MTAKVIKMSNRKNKITVKTEIVTPERAMTLLDANRNNRPLSQMHVNNIAAEIKAGKWQFNGDTIKIAVDKDILDGQHRLWACVLAETSIKTIIVTGIKKESFTTIDTLKRSRSFADVLAVAGLTRHRTSIGSALAWLLRWQRGAFPYYKRLEHRVSNRDIAEAWADHSRMADAIERTLHTRRIGPLPLLGMLYYIFSNRDPDIANRFISTLENPVGVDAKDPFFVYRSYLLKLQEEIGRREPVMILAIGIKAWNAACQGRKVEYLRWNTQGKNAEDFPRIVSPPARA